MNEKFLFTSESVTEGHPDKIADQISDAVLDAHLVKDSNARVGCETLINSNLVVLAGEITAKSIINYEKIVRDTITEIGYTNPDFGFDVENCNIIISLNKQSNDIAQGVDEGAGLHTEQGAGDQGIMFGYATNENDSFMPMPIYLSHKLALQLAKVRKNNEIEYLRPDGKVQVTVEYENNIPTKVNTVVISAQHNENIDHEQIKTDLIQKVGMQSIPENMITEKTRWLINPTGKFIVGGPLSDAGLTGRKIIMDTYGGMGRHGGGAFSGKDPSKTDRSAAYAARYIAKKYCCCKIS